MKTHLLLLLTSLSLSFNAQDFTWVKGSTSSSVAGTYGTQGVSAPTNNPSGRHGCAKWTDAAGNLWLFGGEGFSTNTTLGWMNDLWKYTASTNEWTWIRGSNTPNTISVYGFLGVSSATNEPGAREFPTCWTDASGNFWMFGGDGFASNSTFGRLGDLWKYNPTTNQWTWINGFNTVGQLGIYGTLGTAAASNSPGCRYGGGIWADNSGNFWMFGGRGLSSTGPQGYLSDLWKYTISTNQWTWVNGSNLAGQNSIYGSLGVTAPSNMPGGRYFPISWIDGL